jgi:hypothetical protein
VKDCCKETYKKTLEEVIIHIKSCKHKSFAHLIMVLQYAVDMLNEPKIEIDKIFLNEMDNK